MAYELPRREVRITRKGRLAALVLKADPEPGDVVLVGADPPLTPALVADLAETLHGMGISGVTYIALPDGTAFSAYSPNRVHVVVETGEVIPLPQGALEW